MPLKFTKTELIFSIFRQPDISLLDGPSTSGLSAIACATVSGGVTAVAGTATSAQCLKESHNSSDDTNENSPTTPNSTASTVPLVSPPQSPLDQNDQQTSNISKPSNFINNITTTNMPAKSHQPIPVIVTTTTTAEIMDVNIYL